MNQKYKFAIVFLVVGLLVGSFITYSFSQGSSTFTLTSGIYPGAPDFTIYKEVSTYYAKNQYGSIASSGTNASQVLSSIIGSHNIISGISREETILNVGVLTAPWLTISSGVHDLTLEHMTIDGNGQTQKLITITNNPSTHHITFDDIHFTNFGSMAIDATDATTILNEYITIQNCLFDDFTTDGNTNIVTLRASHSLITRNTVIGDGLGTNGAYGLGIWYGNYSEISYNYVYGTSGGVEFWRYDPTINCSSTNKIIGNVLENICGTIDGRWAILYRGGDGVVSNNQVFNVTRSAIVYEGSNEEGGGEIEGNTVNLIRSNGTGSDIGIWVHGYSNTHWSNSNVISGNKLLNVGLGIVVNYDAHSLVSNNNIRYCQGQGIYTSTASANTTIFDNSVSDCSLNGSSAFMYPTTGILVVGDYNTIGINDVRNNIYYDLRVDWAATGTTIIGFNSRYSVTACPISNVGTDTTIHVSYNGTSFITSYP